MRENNANFAPIRSGQKATLVSASVRRTLWKPAPPPARRKRAGNDQVGPLGNYYELTNSVLINADTNTTADQVGLYHYTVTTNLINSLEIKETNSLVDVSFHYVATDSNGNPIDTDGNGIPDYIKDVNGNGAANSGEIAWLSSNTTPDRLQSQNSKATLDS